MTETYPSTFGTIGYYYKHFQLLTLILAMCMQAGITTHDIALHGAAISARAAGP
jgi:hypothetical protein